MDLTGQLKQLLLTTILFVFLVPYSYGAVLNYANGGRYVGPTVNSEPHGKGKIYWPDGTQYVGEFRQGKWFHGQGTFTLGKDKKNPGNTIVGEWRDGKPWNAINYNADKTIRGSYTNGKWCFGEACNNNVGGSKIWCANEHWAMRTSRTVCKSNGGKVFDNEFDADAEHKRLKAAAAKVSNLEKVWCAHSGEPTYVSKLDCKSFTGMGFTLREEAQEYDKLNKKFEVLAGENILFSTF